MDIALEEYGIAEEMFPDNLEMKFWKALAMANSDRLEEALPVFATIFEEVQISTCTHWSKPRPKWSTWNRC